MYSVGQAAQPILSVNYVARLRHRIKETLKYALCSITFFSILWTALSLFTPKLFVNIFMALTGEILKIAPKIIGCYGLSFLLLPLNIFSTYYFQALLNPKTALIVSVSRGLIISGILLYLLPLFAPDALWLAMPLTEFLTAVYVVYQLIQSVRKLYTASQRSFVSILLPCYNKNMNSVL